MKSLLRYYLLFLVLPFLVIFLILKFDIFDKYSFIIPISFYVLIYRPLIDYYRLKSKGVAVKSILSMLNPYYTIKYFKILYFNL